VSSGGGTALSGATCQYTTGSARAIATYATDYCEVTGLSPTATINIRFRIADLAGNTGTGGIGTYYYDATPPVITPANWTINS